MEANFICIFVLLEFTERIQNVGNFYFYFSLQHFVESSYDVEWVLGSESSSGLPTPHFVLRTEMPEVHHNKKQGALNCYPRSSRSIPHLQKSYTIFQLVDDNSQFKNMIGSIRYVSRGIVSRGASLKQMSAMSTIVLPDLTFEYSHLEPVVHLTATFLNLDVICNTTLIYSDNSTSFDNSSPNFDASYPDIC